MRKITEKKHDKKKRNATLSGLVLVFLMFASVLGYGFLSREPPQNEAIKMSYNGYEFFGEGNYWKVNMGSYYLVFSNHPKEVEDVNVKLNSLADYYNKPLYISSESDLATAEIYSNMQGFVERVQNACLEGADCPDDFPIKTCEDNLIIIKKAEENKLEQKDNCVFIEGSEEDLIKITDEFLFRVFGIKE